jgi:hypothetical protein
MLILGTCCVSVSLVWWLSRTPRALWSFSVVNCQFCVKSLLWRKAGAILLLPVKWHERKIRVVPSRLRVACRRYFYAYTNSQLLMSSTRRHGRNNKCIELARKFTRYLCSHVREELISDRRREKLAERQRIIKNYSTSLTHFLKNSPDIPDRDARI